MSEKTTTATPLGEILEQAEQLLESGQVSEATELLSRTRRELPADAPQAERSRLHLLTGRALAAGDRGAEALAHYKRALELGEEVRDLKSQAAALEQLGASYHQRQEFHSSSNCLQRAAKLLDKLEDRAGLARCLRNLGACQVDSQSYAAAKTSYSEAQRLYKEVGDIDGLANCVANVALLLYRDPGRPAAIAEYRRALAEDACEHFLVLNNLGFLLTLEHEFEEAKGFMSRARAELETREQKEDNLALALLNLSNLEALTGNYEAARDLFEQAAREFATLPAGRAVEVLLIPCQGHEDKGFERFLVAEDGLKRCVTHLNRATLLSWMGKSEEAMAEGERAVTLDRDQPYPYLVMGWLCHQAGDTAAATRNFRKAVGMEPANEHYQDALRLVNPYLSNKVGRNDPCPCGSGKKFKKCHGVDA